MTIREHLLDILHELRTLEKEHELTDFELITRVKAIEYETEQAITHCIIGDAWQ